MKKRQAVARFHAEVAPGVMERFGKDDEPAWAEAWNDWTDMLCKNGEITAKQYSTWAHPTCYWEVT